MDHILAHAAELTTQYAYFGSSTTYSVGKALTSHFSKQEKLRNRVPPKGYAEMLEGQQMVLISGLQEMYRRLKCARLWAGPALVEFDGRPLTHEILASLNLWDPNIKELLSQEGSSEMLQEIQSSSTVLNAECFTQTAALYHVPTPEQCNILDRTRALVGRSIDFAETNDVSSVSIEMPALRVESQRESLVPESPVPEFTWQEEQQMDNRPTKGDLHEAERTPPGEIFGKSLECLVESQLSTIDQLGAHNALRDRVLDFMDFDYEWTMDCQFDQFDLCDGLDVTGNNARSRISCV